MALPRAPVTLLAVVLGAALLAGCGESRQTPVDAGIGPQPKLPPPSRSLLPTVNIATAKGWPSGAQPTAAPGLEVKAFARGLDHPRWLYVLPNGDVLVAETNAPPKPRGRQAACKRLGHEEGDGEGGRRRAERRTASRCCATRTATASPRRAACSSKA